MPGLYAHAQEVRLRLLLGSTYQTVTSEFSCFWLDKKTLWDLPPCPASKLQKTQARRGDGPTDEKGHSSTSIHPPGHVRIWCTGGFTEQTPHIGTALLATSTHTAQDTCSDRHT